MNPIRQSRLWYLLTPPRSLRTLSRGVSNSPSSSTSIAASRETQTVTLPDGRTISYAEYGPAAGYPVLFFHGYPSSRLEAGPIAHIAIRQGIRVIAPDRPGFGLSTFQPGRRITSWPADVSYLTSFLGLDRFAILGGSGGGPYALACAHALPHAQMSAVGVLAGAPPWDAGTKEVLWLSWLVAMAASYTPGLLKIVADASVRGIRWIVGTEWAKARIDAWLEELGKKEKERKSKKPELKGGKGGTRPEDDEGEQNLTTEDQRIRLLYLLFEPFAQGAAASVQEAQLLTQSWGFRFADVKFDRIQVWHGTHDVNAPISMIRWMANRLPHCELKEFDDSHFTIVDHLDEILMQLVSNKTRQWKPQVSKT